VETNQVVSDWLCLTKVFHEIGLFVSVRTHSDEEPIMLGVGATEIASRNVFSECVQAGDEARFLHVFLKGESLFSRHNKSKHQEG